MTNMTTMLSYHNDPDLKTIIVKEMELHKKQDQFIKGTYEKLDWVFKGCAVGCAIDSFNRKLGKKYSTNDHHSYEEAIGVPEWLARLQDTIFEGLPNYKSSKFAVDLLKAIPVGKDLTSVKWSFTAFILRENIERVLSLALSDELKTQVVSSIRGVLNLNEDAILTGVWNVSAARSAAESAASAAASSARSAAESARNAAESARNAAASARSAAESARNAAASSAWSARDAARSAAASSAWSAAYSRYSKELIKLLKAL